MSLNDGDIHVLVFHNALWILNIRDDVHDVPSGALCVDEDIQRVVVERGKDRYKDWTKVAVDVKRGDIDKDGMVDCIVVVNILKEFVVDFIC